VTEDPRPSGGPSPDPAASAGLVGLLEGLAAGLARLFRHQMALAGAEARQSLARLRTGLLLLALAALLALVALHVAAATAVAALVAAGVGPVLSPLAVTLALLALVGLSLWAGLRRLSARSLMPHRTLAAMRQNGETLVNMVKSDA
jgi:hypothetical protein